MKLIIGLGNPGREYETTRHNLGFMALDALRQELELPEFKENKKFQSLVSKGKRQNEEIILAKPLTFMNSSGEAVSRLFSYYKISLSDLLVIHDDIDLPWGAARLVRNRGSAGHKGVESVISSLGAKNFSRIKVGIAPAVKKETKKFVLGELSKKEGTELPAIMDEVKKTVYKYIK
ncbi:aminoacyl-tRNA hydrolase [Candidatus Uhrbacteria bacterium]|nr:aminoacyl-tRNA hydrolase [Candidatus Uhrbacteria bacterium]